MAPVFSDMSGRGYQSVERVDPFTIVAEMSEAMLGRILGTGARLLRENFDGGERLMMLDVPGAETGAPRRRRRGGRHRV
jgi:hypothetical protein